MIEITPAMPVDLAAVRALLQAEGLPTDDVGEALLDHSDVARDDGEPVGCVAIEPLGEIALLRSLAVAATHRNRGLGARLVAAAEQRAAAGGAGRVWLLTTTARDFFAARGYAVEPRDAAPPALRGTRQFASLCPATAVLMSKVAPARPFNVLFLCTGNSARSILAEALVNHWGRGQFRGFSAGSHPTGRVNPLALELLQRMSIAAPGARSKSWDEFAAPGAPALDCVITVCDSAAGEVCPIWPGQPLTAHWGVADPAAVQGSELDRTQAFRQAFNALEQRIKLFTSLPVGSLDRLRLKQELDAIGRSSPPEATA